MIMGKEMSEGASADADRATDASHGACSTSPPSVGIPSAWVEHVARALYAERPFVIASTATTFGHQVAKTYDWDGAPAYYQEDMRQLARATLAALMQPEEAMLCLSWRPDGGLRIYSPSHPGLVLSHSRPDLVMLDVLPVLAEMGFARPCDSDTHAQRGDVKQAPLVSGAGRRHRPEPSHSEDE